MFHVFLHAFSAKIDFGGGEKEQKSPISSLKGVVGYYSKS